MSPLNLPRLVLGLALSAGVVAVDVAAQPRPAGTPKPGPALPADFERLAEVFAPPGTPAVRGKPWVAADTGPANAASALTGWLVEDGDKEVTLLDGDGDLHRLRKPAPGKRRPTLAANKDGTLSYTLFREADRSVAWKVRPEDFAAHAKKFLADGIPSLKEDRGFRDLTGGRFALQAHVIDAARLAHFAHQQGQAEAAARLHTHALAAHKAYTDRFVGGWEKAGALHEFVADRLAPLASESDGRGDDERGADEGAVPQHLLRHPGHVRAWVKPTFWGEKKVA